MSRGHASLTLVRSIDHVSHDELESVYRAYSRYVAAIALRLLGSDDEVDDVVQEVFVVAMRGLRGLREPGAIRGWLATIVGIEKVWALGVAPFYLATVFKTLLAAACIKAGWSAANLRS